MASVKASKMPSKLKKTEKRGIQDLGVYRWHTHGILVYLTCSTSIEISKVAKMAHHIPGIIIIIIYIYIYICILELVHKSCYMLHVMYIYIYMYIYTYTYYFV